MTLAALLCAIGGVLVPTAMLVAFLHYGEKPADEVSGPAMVVLLVATMVSFVACFVPSIGRLWLWWYAALTGSP